MSEPEGRVCEDPARHRRREGTPEGGAAAGYVSLPSFLAKQERRSPAGGESPANVTLNTGKPPSKGLTRRRSNGMNHQGSRNVWKALPPTGETLQARRAFPCLASHWPGTRPRRATFFLVVRQERRQRRRLALRAQTAAPDFPARCCADQRFRRAFTHTEPLLIQGWATDR